jgi:hypothetical protein
MYYKIINGKVVKGEVIHTPKGTIDAKTKLKPKDGWQWFDDSASASAALGIVIPEAKAVAKMSLSTNPLTSRLDNEIARLEQQLEAKKAQRISLDRIETPTKKIGK